jgi:hypothetical protein
MYAGILSVSGSFGWFISPLYSDIIRESRFSGRRVAIWRAVGDEIVQAKIFDESVSKKLLKLFYG